MHATFKQVDDILELMIKAHSSSVNKAIPYDLEWTRGNLQHWIADPKTVVLVNKSVTACYIMTLAPSWWTSKPYVLDVFLYSETPGSGFRLMKESQEWVDNWGDAIIGESISTSNNDPQVDKMYQRLGLKQTGFTYQRKAS